MGRNGQGLTGVQRVLNMRERIEKYNNPCKVSLRLSARSVGRVGSFAAGNRRVRIGQTTGRHISVPHLDVGRQVPSILQYLHLQLTALSGRRVD